MVKTKILAIVTLLTNELNARKLLSEENNNQMRTMTTAARKKVTHPLSHEMMHTRRMDNSFSLVLNTPHIKKICNIHTAINYQALKAAVSLFRSKTDDSHADKLRRTTTKSEFAKKKDGFRSGTSGILIEDSLHCSVCEYGRVANIPLCSPS
jgi:hypothetical protein